MVFDKTKFFIFDVIACIPFREMGSADLEYFCRLLRVLKIPETLNLIDGRAVSLIIAYFKGDNGLDADKKKDSGI